MPRNDYNWGWMKCRQVPGTDRVEWELDVEQVRRKFEDAQVDASGVVRWRSNHAVPPQDCLNSFAAAGCRFNMDASMAVRDAENAAFIAEYRRNWQPPAGEQLAEMRAAFGAGVELVDVISGRRFTT